MSYFPLTPDQGSIPDDAGVGQPAVDSEGDIGNQTPLSSYPDGYRVLDLIDPTACADEFGWEPSTVVISNGTDDGLDR